MQPIACQYHPYYPARWSCKSCDIELCGSCVKKDLARNLARCPLCNAALRQVAARNFIVPFWRRIGKFFRYPLHSAPLTFIIGLTVIFAALNYLGLVGWVLQALVLLVFVKYAMEVLEQTALGRIEPDVGVARSVNEGMALALAQMLVFFLMYSLTYFVSHRWGAPAGWTVLAALLFLAPASSMVLAAEGRLPQALYPPRLLHMVRSIAWSYGILLLFLFLLFACHAALTSLLGLGYDLPMHPLQSLLILYFILVAFHMMGYVVYQYHEELDFGVKFLVDEPLEAERLAQQRHGGGSQHPAYAGVEVLLKEGRVAEAAAQLATQVERDTTDLVLHDLYHNLLLRAGLRDQLVQHGQDYLALLVHRGKLSKAAQVLQTCLEIDPRTRPRNPDWYYDLARTLAAGHAYRQAVQLSEGFHECFAGHRHTPALYLLTARLLAEHLNDEAGAAARLSYVLERHPDDPLRPQIQRYAELLASLQTAQS